MNLSAAIQSTNGTFIYWQKFVSLVREGTLPKMTKQDHINHWKNSAARDWKASNHLFQSKDFVHSLFFAHLVLEKLSKAHWVKNHTSNHPPRIHNLVYIIDSANVALTEEQLIFLEKMNTFQLEGRYPDYQKKIYRMCNKSFTETYLKQANSLRLWLQKNL